MAVPYVFLLFDSINVPTDLVTVHANTGNGLEMSIRPHARLTESWQFSLFSFSRFLELFMPFRLPEVLDKISFNQKILSLT